MEDYIFLKRCQDHGVQKAKVPKPLKVFHSHKALCERSNGVAMVLLATCCGPGVNMLQVTAQVSRTRLCEVRIVKNCDFMKALRNSEESTRIVMVGTLFLAGGLLVSMRTWTLLRWTRVDLAKGVKAKLGNT